MTSPTAEHSAKHPLPETEPDPSTDVHLHRSQKSILVVDDSPVERCLVAELLSGNDDWTIHVAAGGREALARIELAPLDLLITDLSMPDISGLDLLQHVKQHAPLLPVVVMTAYGSEETAVTALQSGAAGYINKRRLASDVWDVAHSVLEAAEKGRSRAGVFRRMTRQTMEFEFENDLTTVAPLWECIVESCRRLGVVTEGDEVRIAVALEEAISNAVIHGNLEVESAIREASGADYARLIKRRQAEEPYATRRLFVRCDFSPTEARISIRDEGPGFDVSALPDPREPQRMTLASGRGILLMRAFMDEVIYNETGNRVTLIKRRAEDDDVHPDSARDVTCRSTETAPLHG